MRRQLQRCIVPVLALFGLPLLLHTPVYAQGGKKPAPKPQPPAKPTPGTIGTKQMEGSEGQVGVTYSLKTNEALDPQFNLTITSVSYTTGGYRIADKVLAPGRGQKYLVIRYTCQNPNKTDIDIPADFQSTNLFQAVGNDNKTYTPEGDFRTSFLDNPSLAPGKPYAQADLKLKPGQKSEMVFALIPIPSEVIVPKLIIKRGRVGTNEQVMRFDLRDKVKAEYGAFANTATPLVPRDDMPGTLGTAYPLASLEISISDMKREAGPLMADITADDGKEFITGTVALKNIAPANRTLWSDYAPKVTVVTDDGEKFTFDPGHGFLRTNRSSRMDPGEVESLDSRKAVFYIQIPKGTKVKQLIVSEINFPDFETRRLTYDISSL